MSELRTNRIVPRDGLTSGTFGGIIQVVQTVKQTAQEITYAGGEQDVMSATINLEDFRNYYPEPFKFGEVDAGEHTTYEIKDYWLDTKPPPNEWKNIAINQIMKMIEPFDLKA